MGEKAPEWTLSSEHAVQGKFVRYNKKHPIEYAALFANLNKLFALLNSGNKIGGFHIGFSRSEGEGVYRIGQTSVRAARESRLYILPHEVTKTVYILMVGDKDSQSDDVREAKRIAKTIQSGFGDQP